MNALVDSYLDYIQTPNIMYMTESEMIEYINEAFINIDKDKIKKQITENSKQIRVFLYKFGIDIKKVAKNDASQLINIIKKGFQEGKQPQNVAKKVLKKIIQILKRIWKPPEETSIGEKITSGMVIGLVTIFAVACINTFITRISVKVFKKAGSGAISAITLFLKWLLSGAFTEELMKRFFIKKYGKLKGIGLGGVFFGFIEAILYKIQRGEPIISGALNRMFMHSYTAFVQAMGIKLDEVLGNEKRTFEYMAFIFMICLHAYLNMRNTGTFSSIAQMIKHPEKSVTVSL